MSREQFIELIRDLAAIPGPAGREEAVARAFAARLKDLAAEAFLDPMGNAIIKIAGRNAKASLMVCAHTDEVGLIVKAITPDGLLYFDLNGGIDPRTLPATPVEVLGAEGPVAGVVVSPSAHLSRPEDRAKPIPVHDLWIQVGASSDAEAKALGIRIGDPVTFRANFQELAGGYVATKALDDRAGLAILIAAIRRAARRDMDYDLYAVAPVQEEIGARGAGVVARALRPAAALIVDTVSSAEPGVPTSRAAATCEKGPIIRVWDYVRDQVRGTVYDRRLVDRLLAAAERNGIRYQTDAAHTWTDGAAITLEGIPAGGIFVPRRGSHSACEVMSLVDAEAATDLLAAFLEGLTGADLAALSAHRPL
jgi:endoglucanase